MKEFKYLKPIINNLKSKLEKSEKDSIYIMVDQFIEELHSLSCIYCVAEGQSIVFPEFCRKNRKALLIVAEKYFQGYSGRLKNWFQSMFKEFYPEAYDRILIDANIKKAKEWRDVEEEYKLPIDVLINKYIEIEFKQ